MAKKARPEGAWLDTATAHRDAAGAAAGRRGHDALREKHGRTEAGLRAKATADFRARAQAGAMLRLTRVMKNR